MSNVLQMGPSNYGYSQPSPRVEKPIKEKYAEALQQIATLNAAFNEMQTGQVGMQGKIFDALANKSQENESLHRRLLDLDLENQTLRRENDWQQSTKTILITKFHELKAEKATLTQANTGLTEQTQELSQENEHLITEHAELTRQVQELAEQINTMSSRLRSQHTLINQQREMLHNQGRQLHEQRRVIQQLQAESGMPPPQHMSPRRPCPIQVRW